MEACDFLTIAERLLPPRIARWRRELAAASLATGVDPVLLAAIMDRETNGGDAKGYEPRGSPAGTGDGGHGRGLMQIDDRAHAAFCSGDLWRRSDFNVLYGAHVLKEALYAFSGRELPALCAYNAGAVRVRRAMGAGRTPDSVTTGGDYGTDVLSRRDVWLSAYVKGPHP